MDKIVSTLFGDDVAGHQAEDNSNSKSNSNDHHDDTNNNNNDGKQLIVGFFAKSDSDHFNQR